jgi:hypothetical protein
MKTKLYTLTFASIFSIQLNAQITQEDLPNAGDTATYAVANALGTSTGTSGNNQTWDYSDLSANNSERVDFVSVSDAGFTYAFVFGLPFSGSYSDMAQKGVIPLPQILLDGINALGLGVSFGDTYNFFKRESDGLVQKGFGADVSGFGLPVQYSTPDEIIPIPLTLNNTSTIDYSYELELPSIGVWSVTAERTNEVNGKGTLILPNATYQNVYRVRSAISSQNIISSDQLPAFLNGVPIPRDEVKYLYIAPSLGFPVLEITATSLFGFEVVSKVIYRATPVDYTSIENNEITDFQLFPNPASNYLTIQTQLKKAQKLTFEILDAQGRMVWNETRQATAGAVFETISLNENAIANGIYLLKITPETGRPEVRSFVVQNQ